MGLRMKDFNIFEVHWKIWFSEGGVHKKPIYMGGLPRPWHGAQVIACAHAITCANQEKGGLRGDDKPA